jgi:hypothetical protein
MGLHDGLLMQDEKFTPTDERHAHSAAIRILTLLRANYGSWLTPAEIGRTLSMANVAAVSANLRNLRKKDFGRHRIISRYRYDERGGKTDGCIQLLW